MQYIKTLMVFIVLFTLVGCGMSAEEKIYSHLEKAVSLENVFVEQQQPIVELELKEQELHKKIIQLGMSDFEQIKTLSNEALAVIDEREVRIEKEKESINAAEKEFLLIEPRIEKLADAGTKEIAVNLLKIMQERYEAYDKLYGHYKEAILLDRELYKLFQREDLTLEQLESQINKINETYEDIVKAYEVFNDRTDTYNEKKKEFYQSAGLNVTFTNNEAPKETVQPTK